MKTAGKYKFEKFISDLTQESFTDFFDFYYRRLLQFTIVIVKSEVLAEEVVLDVFMKIWEKRNHLTDINNIETYLYISARNNSISLIKKEQKFHFDLLEDSHVQLAGYKPSADINLIENEMFEALNDAVSSLPSKSKIIFKLIREDGLNRNEVAQILDISVKTVDNQVAIAIRKIAKKLGIDLSNPNNSIKLTSFLFSL